MELFVTLTTERKAELMDEAARHYATMEALEAKKKREAELVNGEIKVEEEHVARIMRVVRNQGESRDQMSLSFEEKQQATEALAQLYRRAECTPVDDRWCAVHGACTCNQETPDVHDPACALHGVDAAHAKDAPLPEPAGIPSEDDEIQATARAFVESLNGKLPESVNETNHLLTGYFTATGVAQRRRARVRKAAKALLGDAPLPPAGAGAGEPAEDEADDVARETPAGDAA